MNKLTLLTKVAIRDPNKSIWKKIIKFLFYKNKNKTYINSIIKVSR